MVCGDADARVIADGVVSGLGPAVGGGRQVSMVSMVSTGEAWGQAISATRSDLPCAWPPGGQNAPTLRVRNRGVGGWQPFPFTPQQCSPAYRRLMLKDCGVLYSRVLYDDGWKTGRRDARSMAWIDQDSGCGCCLLAVRGLTPLSGGVQSSPKLGSASCKLRAGVEKARAAQKSPPSLSSEGEPPEPQAAVGQSFSSRSATSSRVPRSACCEPQPGRRPMWFSRVDHLSSCRWDKLLQFPPAPGPGPQSDDHTR